MNKKHYILIIFLILLDQITKMVIVNKQIQIIPNFLNFTYTQNTGGAFGIGKISLITILSIIIVIGFIIYINKNNNKILNYFPYCLVFAGAISNMIDRLFRGYVIDFIDVNVFNFPNFNIADICLVIGIFLVCFELLKSNKKDEVVN